MCPLNVVRVAGRPVDRVQPNFKLLLSKFSDNVTNAKKETMWKNIAIAINSVSPAERTVAELQKKWDDLKSHTKKLCRWCRLCRPTAMA